MPHPSQFYAQVYEPFGSQSLLEERPSLCGVGTGRKEPTSLSVSQSFSQAYPSQMHCWSFQAKWPNSPACSAPAMPPSGSTACLGISNGQAVPPDTSSTTAQRTTTTGPLTSRPLLGSHRRRPQCLHPDHQPRAARGRRRLFLLCGLHILGVERGLLVCLSFLHSDLGPPSFPKP